jgi:hypothetical protein
MNKQTLQNQVIAQADHATNAALNLAHEAVATLKARAAYLEREIARCEGSPDAVSTLLLMQDTQKTLESNPLQDTQVATQITVMASVLRRLKALAGIEKLQAAA